MLSRGLFKANLQFLQNQAESPAYVTSGYGATRKEKCDMKPIKLSGLIKPLELDSEEQVLKGDLE